VVSVSDEALLRAMHLLWERMKIVVEPTGALATAGLLEGAVDVTDRRVGVVVTGGNVDLGQAAEWFGDL
jgi:threonine dehydratase